MDFTLRSFSAAQQAHERQCLETLSNAHRCHFPPVPPTYTIMPLDLTPSESSEETSCTEDVPQDAQCSLERPEVCTLLQVYPGADGANVLQGTRTSTTVCRDPRRVISSGWLRSVNVLITRHILYNVCVWH